MKIESFRNYNLNESFITNLKNFLRYGKMPSSMFMNDVSKNIGYMMTSIFSSKDLASHYDIKLRYRDGNLIEYSSENVGDIPIADFYSNIIQMEIYPKGPVTEDGKEMPMILNFRTNEITIGSSKIYVEKKDIQYIFINLRTCLQFQKKAQPVKMSKSDNHDRRYDLLIKTLNGYEEQLKREKSDGEDTTNTENEIKVIKSKIESMDKKLKTFEEFILMYNGPNYNGVYPNAYPPTAQANNGILAANVMPTRLSAGNYEFVYSMLTDKYYGIDELQDLFYEYVNKCKVNGDDPMINNWDQIALGNIDTIIKYIQ